MLRTRHIRSIRFILLLPLCAQDYAPPFLLRIMLHSDFLQATGLPELYDIFSALAVERGYIPGGDEKGERRSPLVRKFSKEIDRPFVEDRALDQLPKGWVIGTGHNGS
jgi:hypothetical protein